MAKTYWRNILPGQHLSVLTDLVAEISASNLFFIGSLFRQELYISANKSYSPTALFYLPLYIYSLFHFITKPSYH
jgi:hypothetical protein